MKFAAAITLVLCLSSPVSAIEVEAWECSEIGRDPTVYVLRWTKCVSPEMPETLTLKLSIFASDALGEMEETIVLIVNDLREEDIADEQDLLGLLSLEKIPVNAFVLLRPERDDEKWFVGGEGIAPEVEILDGESPDEKIVRYHLTNGDDSATFSLRLQFSFSDAPEKEKSDTKQDGIKI